MSTTDTLFAGSIPALYDRFMVPLLFAPYAELVADRAKAFNPKRILETAAGTGVVTEQLHRTLPEAEIVATDLNAPMLMEAGRRLDSPKVRFQPADALELPFADDSFDLVVCQFGIMFYPDKVKGNVEARRVLRDGGRYLLVIWDRIDRNLATMAVGEAVARLFPDSEASNFMKRIPFGYHERTQIEADLRAAGFTEIDFTTAELRSRSGSALDAATGLVQGTPMRSEIEQRDPALLQPATDAAAEALHRYEGPNGLDAPMSAHIVTATK